MCNTLGYKPCVPFLQCECQGLCFDCCVFLPCSDESGGLDRGGGGADEDDDDDERAPLTGGFEEEAVTLHPGNPEYIVLERGC